ncbi:uncharacterized protein LOC113232603 [Hyposmocoma kahamanoa]|uniref:uncharacterized protein LOC113232603 n=1 Tax=Hyposmocoma kahamanoa TaxID=1477025 RepID=UPI000E6D7023|nr:uncharacterized protein LOC113232603 [Hyposmocoma kahamanoa]
MVINLWRAVQEVSAKTTELGGVLTVSVGPVTVYVVTDPEDSTTVANNCLAKEGFYRFARPWLGNGLATAKLPIWKTHRKLLNPSFSPSVVDSFIQIFNMQAKRLVKSLEVEVDKGPFDHWHYTRIYALETICLTTLGVDLNDNPVIKQYLEAAEEMFEVLVKRFHNVFLHKTKFFNWTSLKKKQDELLEKLHQLDYVVLERKQSNIYGNGVPENSWDKKGIKSRPFLDLLLDISSKKDLFTKQDIVDHVESIVLGGHDTSAAALMYIMVLIGSHPKVQEKIFEELNEVFGDSDREVEKCDLTSLAYLEAVIKESMRILPIAPIMARNVDRNLKLKNYTLTAGRMCFISVYGINRHPIWGKDAHVFKPERWLDHATLPDQPNAFATFSMGRRHCIGKGYALMSLKVTLSHILRHYRITGEWDKMQLKVDVMLKSEEGHHISLKRRCLCAVYTDMPIAYADIIKSKSNRYKFKFTNEDTIVRKVQQTVILYTIWLYRQHAAKSENEPPALPGALPLIGNAHHMIGDSLYLWNLVKEMTQDSFKVGGVVSASVGPRTVYIITDPDDATTVANTCLEKDGFYEFAKPWLGEGLVTGKLSIWKNHRKLLNPAFSQLVLDSFIGVFNKQARRLVKDLEVEVGKGPFDHWTYTRHNALETICLTALGVDFTDHTLLNSKYVNATEEMFNVLVERFQNLLMHNHWLYSWTRLKRKQDKLLKILHSMADVVLQTRKSEMKGNIISEKITDKKLGSKFKPFLDLLLELTSEKHVFNDREIREHIDTMIVGGHDTSAAVIMYTMLMIGSHPEVQDNIYRELEDVFGDSDRDVDKHDLCKLMYLEAVIKESMRVIPIVPVIARQLDRNVKLKNYTLCGGRTCFIFLYGLNHHPVWGKDVEEFKPQRWLDPTTLPEHPNAFAGFSMGKRHCIGKAYALMSMKATMAHVMRQYKLKSDWTKLQVKIDVMLKPVGTGHYITIERR